MDLRCWIGARSCLRWDSWYNGSALLVLDAADSAFQQITRTPSSQVWRALIQSAKDPANGLRVACGQLQRALYQKLMDATRPIAEDRMCERIQRWCLDGAALRVARRILRRLQNIRRLVPPRVSAAALSTLWNRWTTARRFQRQGLCVLGCQNQEDSVEHYSRCPTIRSFALNFVRLSIPPTASLAHFMLADGSLDDQDRLTRMGIVVYAAYRTTENLRRNPVKDSPVVAHMLQQGAREAVAGHLSAACILDGNPA